MTIACKKHHYQHSGLPADSGQVYVARYAEVYARINDGCVYVQVSMCMSFVRAFMSVRVCITVRICMCVPMCQYSYVVHVCLSVCACESVIVCAYIHTYNYYVCVSACTCMYLDMSAVIMLH